MCLFAEANETRFRWPAFSLTRGSLFITPCSIFDIHPQRNTLIHNDLD